MWAPAFFATQAHSMSCSSVSTAQGPAMTVKEPSPIPSAPTRTTVSFSWNSRLASL